MKVGAWRTIATLLNSVMTRSTKQRIVIACSAWILFFEVPGPRQVYDFVFGGVHNPQYLFAGSEREVCRRVRRVVENGKANIFIENLSAHDAHIYHTHEQLRSMIVVCSNLKQQ